MSETTEIGQLVSEVFRAWQQGGIDFLILRNYEQLPNFTTNDIDVLVRATQRQSAELALLSAAQQAGYRLHNRAEFATLALYLFHPKTGLQAHFDLFTDLKWRGFDFLCAREFLSRKVNRGLFSVPHTADEANTNLMASLIYTARVKEKYKPSIAKGFRAESAAATALLARTCGQQWARFLVAAGSKKKWAEIEAATHRLRRVLILRQFAQQPFKTLASLSTNALRLAGRFCRSPGLTVVLCGADGCGKTTVARGITEGLSGTFSPQKGAHFHWKPPLLSHGRRALRGPVSTPHANPPRNLLVSVCYFAFHWVEFFFGSHLRLRPLTFKGGLVLIDRFYYDFFVDQRRYRLQVPHFLVACGYRFLPKPDLVFLLDAPTDVLQSRKQEVTPEETERQRRAYLELARSLPNGRVIDGGQPREKVAAEIQNAILEFMAERTRRRLGFEAAAGSPATGHELPLANRKETP